VVDTCWSIDRTARSYISCTTYWYNIYSCYNTTSAISRARSISQNDFSLLSLRPRRSSSVPKIPYARFASSTTTTGSFSRAANKCLSPSTSSTFVSVSSLSWQSNRVYRTRVRSTIKWLRKKGVFHPHPWSTGSELCTWLNHPPARQPRGAPGRPLPLPPAPRQGTKNVQIRCSSFTFLAVFDSQSGSFSTLKRTLRTGRPPRSNLRRLNYQV